VVPATVFSQSPTDSLGEKGGGGGWGRGENRGGTTSSARLDPEAAIHFPELRTSRAGQSLTERVLNAAGVYQIRGILSATTYSGFVALALFINDTIRRKPGGTRGRRYPALIIRE